MAEVNLDNESTIDVDLQQEETTSSNIVVGSTLNTSVPDINYIPGYVEAETERRANEIIRQSNEQDRIALYEDMESKLESGYFKGDKGDTGEQGPKGDKGDTGDTGASGFSPTISSDKVGKVTTLTITDINGTATTEIDDGEDGSNGVSPTATISKVGKVATITITDLNGTTTAEISDGADGTGSGDMSTSVYDTNVNGIVDNAELVNNHTVESDVPSDAVFTDTTYSKLSEFTNDSGYVTNTDYATSSTGGVIKSSTVYGVQVSSSTGVLYGQTKAYSTYLSGENNLFISKGTLENVITGKGLATTSDIPTNVSELTNDSGFITSYTETDPLFVASASYGITSSDITTWNNKSDFSGDYNDLSNLPTIPSTTSELTNDSGYVTNTDYGTSSTGGVIRVANGLGINTTGTVYAEPKTYTQYTSATTGLFVSKGTLENVLDGKGLIPVVLYDGSTTGDITLSDDASNYSYLEIYYQSDSLYYCNKIYSPDGKSTTLMTQTLASTPALYGKTKSITISGTSISVDSYSQYNLGASAYNYLRVTSTYNLIYITRVVGYK